MRRLLIATLLLTATACKRTTPPAEKVGVSFVAEVAGGIELRFTIYGPGGSVLEPENGTVVYSVYDGRPAGRAPVCEARGAITKDAYRVPEGVEHMMEVRPTWARPCPPRGVAKRYGIVSYIAPDGKVAKASESMVPAGLGGSGKFEFPDRDGESGNPSPERSDGDVMREKLRALGVVSPPDDVPLGRPCPTRAAVNGVLRIDRRLVPPPSGRSIGADVEATFRAVNDEPAQAFVRALQGGTDPPGKDLDIVELVKVDVFEPPKVEKSPRPNESGTFTPGKFAGEVWVTDIATRTVLCRASATATSTRDASGKGAIAAEAALDRAFADAVGASINRAARELAPWLPNTWP